MSAKATAGTSGGLGEDDLAEVRVLGGELRTAVARIYSRFRSERGEGEMGEAAVIVLTTLHKHGPQSLTDLSRRAHVSPSSMSQTVNRLVAGGHAVREKDPADGRRVLFHLTPDGAEHARAALAVRRNWLDGRLAELSAAERQALLEASRIMRRLADT
ncbi:MarR family winged helix-turn-helix transcriptional regulator [Actinoallomurus iriomotensis]|uniref:MarR family transcriptional regulator n=1 Tax=Actinoallomurus iriomotensis TaxID=478107 RepID=A0A9W6S753_9ACTN|nr:MarR family transcriptional regulator [Actinoallomurus iriomotensis]GLY88411.1 MarR family transcriptional regulator [Actinoallomurus iriomotensis]